MSSHDKINHRSFFFFILNIYHLQHQGGVFQLLAAWKTPRNQPETTRIHDFRPLIASDNAWRTRQQREGPGFRERPSCFCFKDNTLDFYERRDAIKSAYGGFFFFFFIHKYWGRTHGSSVEWNKRERSGATLLRVCKHIYTCAKQEQHRLGEWSQPFPPELYFS